MSTCVTASWANIHRLPSLAGPGLALLCITNVVYSCSRCCAVCLFPALLVAVPAQTALETVQHERGTGGGITAWNLSPYIWPWLIHRSSGNDPLCLLIVVCPAGLPASCLSVCLSVLIFNRTTAGEAEAAGKAHGGGCATTEPGPKLRRQRRPINEGRQTHAQLECGRLEHQLRRGHDPRRQGGANRDGINRWTGWFEHQLCRGHNSWRQDGARNLRKGNKRANPPRMDQNTNLHRNDK
jgi:hypothetical protein